VGALSAEVRHQRRCRSLFELARNVAETKVDLLRVYRVRGGLISGVPGVVQQLVEHPDGLDNLHDVVSKLTLVDRYERRVLSRQKSAIRDFVTACLAAEDDA
jgi:hypothetical protein